MMRPVTSWLSTPSSFLFPPSNTPVICRCCLHAATVASPRELRRHGPPRNTNGPSRQLATASKLKSGNRALSSPSNCSAGATENGRAMMRQGLRKPLIPATGRTLIPNGGSGSRSSILPPPPQRRSFGTFALVPSPTLRSKNDQMPPRPKPPPDDELEESFLKGSGPGGQKISQATRSRTQNRAIARQILAERLDNLNNGDASRSNIVGEVRRRRKSSSAKKSRRKYRKLDAEGAHEGEEEGEVEQEGASDAQGEVIIEERRG